MSILHQIALTQIPNLGPISGKKLVAYCGGVEEVFRVSNEKLQQIPGISYSLLKNVKSKSLLKKAEKEIAFIEKNKIKTMFFLDKDYPKRLLHCDDSPLILYYKGNADLNAKRVISIVGTRKSTEYGERITEKIVEELSEYNVMIVSGLAYGIDVCAHRAALKNNIQTVAVLGHGLQTIYPSPNRATANKMIENGGLLSEFMSSDEIYRTNFPKRNRIIAALSDATLVVEAAEKGGALITANIADSYNRDVFAIPGKITDTYSRGCNNLIRTNKAAMITSAKDIVYLMGWEKETIVKYKQSSLEIDLSDEQKKIIELLNKKNNARIDWLANYSGIKMNKVAALLLDLEFKGMVKTLPGKVYCLS